MKIVLTENQYQKLYLIESKNSLVDYLKDLKEFADTVIDRTKNDIGINLKMLTIWGAGVGGIIVPLNELIQNGNFNITESQTALILCATAAILFDESKSNIKRLLQEIAQQGITNVFSEVFKKGSKLKKVFINFISSLNMTLYNVTNIMSYAFLIPLLPIFLEISNKGFNYETVKEIVIRLSSFGITSLSANLLREVISKLLNRFKD